MKVAVFGTRKYDLDSLGNNLSPDNDIQFTFLDARLNKITAALASEHDAVCIFVNDGCNAEVIEQLHLHGVKHIALRCSGFNNVDLAAARAHGLSVVRVPAYSPESIAEFAVGMILTVVRKYHKAYNRVREGNFLLDGLLGFNLHGKTVGLIGTGKIGMHTGRILSKGFGCRVLAYDLYPHEEKARECGIEYAQGGMEQVLAEADVVTLHCPLNEGTQYMINDLTLAKMKKGAVLVNTSRGGLIDTDALIRSLKTGHLSAVGLDVYEKESSYFFADGSSKIMHDDNFARLLSFYNVYITGHQAFLTSEALKGIAETTIKNLIDLEKTGTSENLVQ